MATVALFEFDELNSEVHSPDKIGNVVDLKMDATATDPPAAAVAFSGRGRQFSSTQWFIGTEAVSNALKLTRDLTVRGFIQFRNDNFSNGEVGTICVKGFGQSATTDNIPFALEMSRVNSATANIRLRWQNPGLVEASTVGANFLVDPAAFFHFAAVRTWTSATSVLVEYYIDDKLIGSETVTEGNIVGAVNAFLVGASDDGAGTREKFLPDDSILDTLSIENDALCFEEIRQDYRRIAVHQPNGGKILSAYVPPGRVYSRNPDSRFRRWLAAEGDGVGLCIANAEALRDDALPDRAYGAALAAWERITGIAPRQNDTIAARRLNVIGFLRKTLGYAKVDIKTALEPLFGLDSADIEIVEFTGLREDDFSVDDISVSPPSPMWRTLDDSADHDVQIVTATPECRVSGIAASAESHWRWSPGGKCPLRETSINPLVQGGDPEGALIKADLLERQNGAEWIGGLYMRDVSGNAIFFGLHDPGAGFRLGYVVIDVAAATPVSAFTTLATDDFPVADMVLRYEGGGTYSAGTVVAGLYVPLAEGITGGPAAPRWAGFGALKLSTVSNAGLFKFQNAAVFEPNSPRGFTYLAFRDAGLPGTYDIEAAQTQLLKQSGAFMIPFATTDKVGWKLGSGGGVFGRDPLYPLLP